MEEQRAIGTAQSDEDNKPNIPVIKFYKSKLGWLFAAIPVISTGVAFILLENYCSWYDSTCNIVAGVLVYGIPGLIVNTFSYLDDPALWFLLMIWILNILLFYTAGYLIQRLIHLPNQGLIKNIFIWVRSLKRFWKWFRRLVYFVLALAIIFYGTPLILGVITSDIDPPDVSDLQITFVDVPQDQNMYYDLLAFGGPIDADIKATTEITIDDFDALFNHIDGQEWDEEFITKVVNDNRAALSVFDDAVERPFYQYPRLKNSEDFRPDLILPPLNELRQLARVQAMRAFDVFQDDEQKGLDEAVKIIEFGHKLQNTQNTLIQFLVSTAVKELGFTAFNVLANKTLLPSNILVPYINRIESYKNSDEGSEA